MDQNREEREMKNLHNWIADCRINESDGETAEVWLARAINADEVEVDQDGLAARFGTEWRRLELDECRRAIARVEAGV
jgi:hypothetical protein